MAEHDRELLVGVFSTTRTLKLGTGATSSKVARTCLCLVRELDDGSYETQDLGENMLPAGRKAVVDYDTLLANYLPEPEVYQKQVLPRLEELTSLLAWGDRYRRQQKYFSAETEYGKALLLDADNVRATFGIGICYISMNKMDKAQEVFRKLVGMDAAFEPAHKHLFNEFGIVLRKAGMFGHAMEYYGRALAWDPGDEHLLYNLARAAFHQDELQTAIERAHQALAINPELKEALDVLACAERRRCELTREPDSPPAA